MAEMSKPKAPCGHDGEYVIGTYVRCVQGCTKDPFVQPRPPAAKRRAQPGHVDYCGCRPCTLRRRARTVVLRSKDGQEGRVAWDGATDHMTWTVTFAGKVRHWRLVDEDGDELDSGIVDVDVRVGDVLDFDFMTPKATLAVAKPNWRVRDWEVAGWYTKHVDKELTQLAESYKIPDLAGVVTAEPYLLRKWSKKTDKEIDLSYAKARQRAMCANFGIEPLRGTRSDIEYYVEAVEGVLKFRVVGGTGHVFVCLHETTGASLDDERQIAKNVEKQLRLCVAAGVTPNVILDTPLARTNRYMRKAKYMTVYGRDAMFNYIKEGLTAQLAAIVKDVEVRVETDSFAEVQVRYTSANGDRRYLRVPV